MPGCFLSIGFFLTFTLSRTSTSIAPYCAWWSSPFIVFFPTFFCFVRFCSALFRLVPSNVSQFRLTHIRSPSSQWNQNLFTAFCPSLSSQFVCFLFQVLDYFAFLILPGRPFKFPVFVLHSSSNAKWSILFNIRFLLANFFKNNLFYFKKFPNCSFNSFKVNSWQPTGSTSQHQPFKPNNSGGILHTFRPPIFGLFRPSPPSVSLPVTYRPNVRPTGTPSSLHSSIYSTRTTPFAALTAASVTTEPSSVSGQHFGSKPFFPTSFQPPVAPPLLPPSFTSGLTNHSSTLQIGSADSSVSSTVSHATIDNSKGVVFKRV